jgi:hypothetical protein
MDSFSENGELNARARNAPPRDARPRPEEVRARAGAGVSLQNVSEDVELPPALAALAARIEPAELREPLAGTLRGLARLLDYLRLIEKTLGEGAHPQNALVIFKLVRAKTETLVADLRAQAVRAEGRHGALADVLDGTCFALRHELRRAFESQALAGAPNLTAARARADLFRAHGLLLNCFQQSLVSIARVFEPRLTGVQLFDDFKEKQEQAVRLYEGLCELMSLARRAEREGGLRPYLELRKALRAFRAERMHHLMYKDWAEFDSFVQRISTVRQAAELAQLLHQFACYVETLAGHVRMRGVLAERQLRGSVWDF